MWHKHATNPCGTVLPVGTRPSLRLCDMPHQADGVNGGADSLLADQTTKMSSLEFKIMCKPKPQALPTHAQLPTGPGSPLSYTHPTADGARFPQLAHTPNCRRCPVSPTPTHPTADGARFPLPPAHAPLPTVLGFSHSHTHPTANGALG
eukprot:365195-Chlamydomonas_euryale.AAC.10